MDDDYANSFSAQPYIHVRTIRSCSNKTKEFPRDNIQAIPVFWGICSINQYNI